MSILSLITFSSFFSRISFGKGESFWTNVFPSPITERLASDISKFGRVLKTVKIFEALLALVPVYALLRLFGLSKDFGERMVYPLTALFFGTGNQTPYVASAILVGVLPSPRLLLWRHGVDRNASSRTRVCACSNMTSVVSLRAFPKCMHSKRLPVISLLVFLLF